MVPPYLVGKVRGIYIYTYVDRQTRPTNNFRPSLKKYLLVVTCYLELNHRIERGRRRRRRRRLRRRISALLPRSRGRGIEKEKSSTLPRSRIEGIHRRAEKGEEEVPPFPVLESRGYLRIPSLVGQKKEKEKSPPPFSN